MSLKKTFQVTNDWKSSSDLPVVSICCITYNHEQYIEKSIESFLMQKTKFTFEILIHDDASTDNTQLIIKRYEKLYPNMIKPIYQVVNQKSKFKSGMNPRFNYPRSRGKYIALCEGDDYWTDPLKLQKQVDFLEANTDYGLVHTDLDVFHQKQNKITRSLYKNLNLNIPTGNIYNELLVRNTISTLTVMFRNDIIKDILKNEKAIFSFGMGDYPLWLEISLKYKIGFINESTVMYRKLEVSASHDPDIDKSYKMRLNIFKVRSYFIKEYSCHEKTKEEIDKNLYIFNLNYGFNARNKKIAKENYLKLVDMNQDNLDARLKYYGAMSKINWNIIKLYYKLKGKGESLHKRIIS